MAVGRSSFGLVLLLAACIPALLVSASDPDPLADFVGTLKADDFVKRAVNTMLVAPGEGSSIMAVNAKNLAGSASQGISMAFINYAPCGQNPIHNHPRASEMLYMITGQLYVGFIESTNNNLIATTLKAGDVFVFPRGVIHFQQNPSPTEPASAIAALNSQNPGATRIGTALFGPNGIPTTISQVAFNAEAPAIDVLVKAFASNGNKVGTTLTGYGPAVIYPLES